MSVSSLSAVNPDGAMFCVFNFSLLAARHVNTAAGVMEEEEEGVGEGLGFLVLTFLPSIG